MQISIFLKILRISLEKHTMISLKKDLSRLIEYHYIIFVYIESTLRTKKNRFFEATKVVQPPKVI